MSLHNFENRGTFRIPFKRKIIIATEDIVIAGRCENLSLGGVFASFLKMEKLRIGQSGKCIFTTNDHEKAISLNVKVKRIVNVSRENQDKIPGVGLQFTKDSVENTLPLKNYMIQSRKNFEVAATLLSSGEPDIMSLQPLIEEMHLPPFIDLSEMKVFVERTLSEIEQIDK